MCGWYFSISVCVREHIVTVSTITENHSGVRFTVLTNDNGTQTGDPLGHIRVLNSNASTPKNWYKEQTTRAFGKMHIDSIARATGVSHSLRSGADHHFVVAAGAIDRARHRRVHYALSPRSRVSFVRISLSIFKLPA